MPYIGYKNKSILGKIRKNKDKERGGVRIAIQRRVPVREAAVNYAEMNSQRRATFSQTTNDLNKFVEWLKTNSYPKALLKVEEKVVF